MSRPKAPDPFWFGPPERRAFGWYHAPAGTPRDMAVVLCPPLGHEMLCTHRAYRHLAERLASLGFPVLRFDYHGTGDSAGTDRDGDRVPDWLATIDEAIELVRAGGARRVALFGVRIGATFATVVASRRQDVDALVLVAPATSGSAYLRELRAMHRMRERGERRPPYHGQRDGDEEAIGFVFRRETVESLSQVDLRTLASSRAIDVLVVPRDDLPGNEARIADRLRTLGAKVDVVQASGYAVLAADDPYLADVPHAMWDAVSEWLDRSARHVEAPPCLANLALRSPVAPGVTERSLRYGEGERLFGVLSEPTVASGSDLAVIISNTGANTRVGPNRLGVALARRLASRGHAALRIDLAGIGDSAAPQGIPENDLYAIRSVKDVQASVDALVALGYKRFIATGLCAGAYMSFHAGLADRRIGGIVLMNPAALEWEPGRKVERVDGRRGSGFRSTRYYKSRALQLETWRRLARGDVDARGIALTLATRLRERTVSTFKRTAFMLGRGHWVMTDLARQFVSLAQRDARMLLLFNGEEPMIDELDRHLGSMMPWLEKRGLSLEIIDGTDHIFAPVWSQERAIDVVSDFVARFPR